MNLADLFKIYAAEAESTGQDFETPDEAAERMTAKVQKFEDDMYGTIKEYKPEHDIARYTDPDTPEGQTILDIVTGSASSAPMHVARNVVGKAVTNIVNPRGYDIKDKAAQFWDMLKGTSMSRNALKNAVLKDEPLIGSLPIGPRDLPYRAMFDLPPHQLPKHLSPEKYKAWTDASEQVWKEGKNSPFNIVREIAFDPKGKAGKLEIEDIKHHARQKFGGDKPNPLDNRGYSHNVMGDYLLKLSKDKKNVTWEDRWDFDINKSDWAHMRKIIKRRLQTLRGNNEDLTIIPEGNVRHHTASLLARSFMNSITNPVTIKGKMPLKEMNSITNIDELAK